MKNKEEREKGRREREGEERKKEERGREGKTLTLDGFDVWFVSGKLEQVWRRLFFFNSDPEGRRETKPMNLEESEKSEERSEEEKRDEEKERRELKERFFIQFSRFTLSSQLVLSFHAILPTPISVSEFRSDFSLSLPVTWPWKMTAALSFFPFSFLLSLPFSPSLHDPKGWKGTFSPPCPSFSFSSFSVFSSSVNHNHDWTTIWKILSQLNHAKMSLVKEREGMKESISEWVSEWISGPSSKW